MKPMTKPLEQATSDLFHAVMRFECPGRTLATLGGIWPTTIKRWHREGMPQELKDAEDIRRHFGLQPHIWSAPPANVWLYPEFERDVLSESGDKVTYRNEHGIVCTEFRVDPAHKSMPHFEEFPVKNRADWQMLRERLRYSPQRLDADYEDKVARWQRRSAPLIIALNWGGSFFGSLREMMGLERLCVTFYDDPQWIEAMMDAVLELALALTERLLRDFTPDALCLWEDMGYKTGPLLSPALFRRFMLPRYKVLTQAIHDMGVPYVFVDSDGDIRQLIPLWLEGGVDGFVPLERQASMDPSALRAQYGEQVLMIGGVDKRALARGPEAIDAEMEMVRRTVAVGGYVPFFDHGLPHDVPYANFVHFVERLKEATGQA